MRRFIFKKTDLVLLASTLCTLASCTTNQTLANLNTREISQKQKHPRQPTGEIDSQTVYESSEHRFRIVTLGSFNDVVWGFDFLNNNEIIFTGRNTGSINVLNIKSGTIRQLKNVPEVKYPSQGGMLDIRVAPLKSKLPKIYFTYTQYTGSSLLGTVLSSASLQDDTLVDTKELFAVRPGVKRGNQFGSRIEFDKSSHIFVTIGDHGAREKAQRIDTNIGKVIRINMDGSIPEDNPFFRDPNAKKEIWALGLRSPEGLAFNSKTNELWEAEMGPRGGDEINIIERRANYGWPEICWGVEYSGDPVGAGKHEQIGMKQPVKYWNWTEEKHNLTPSALTFYMGRAFPKWQGNIFLGTLATTHLHRLVINKNKVILEEELLTQLKERIRNVRPGPDGFIYFSTDSGMIARIEPAL